MKKPVRHSRRSSLLDIWSLPHFLFGTVVSLFALFFGMPLAETLLITLILAILWEYVEMRLHLRETRLNVVGDVFLPLLACLFTFFLMGDETISFEEHLGLLTAAILLYITITAAAWQARFNHERGFMG